MVINSSLGDRVIEIKDKVYVTMTKQLQAEAILAEKWGIKPELITGIRTKVSDSVEKAFNIIRRPWLGPQG